MKLADAIAYSEQNLNQKIHVKTDHYTIHIFALMRGQEIPEHKSKTTVFITILDGNAKLLINGESFILGTQDTFIIPQDTPHALQAIENFKMSLIK